SPRPPPTGRGPASLTATAVFPTAVGPTSTSSGGALTTSARGRVLCRATALAARGSPRPPESPFYVAQTRPRTDRPAVRADVRRLRLREIRDEPRHLLPLQRGVSLDRGVTGHERQRAMEQRHRLRPARTVDVLHERLDQSLRLLSAKQRGHRAQHHRRADP